MIRKQVASHPHCTDASASLSSHRTLRTHLTSKAVTGFWLTVRVLTSFHVLESHKLTNDFFSPGPALRDRTAGEALTTV